MELTETQIIQLRAQHKKERNSKIRDRIKAVLLINDGYSYEEVARILLVDDSTIYRHIEEYFKSQKLNNNNKGSTPKLNNQQAQELIAHLQSITYVDVKQIIAYITKKYQIQYSKSGITKWLKQNKFVYKKPHAVPAKHNAQKQEEFIETLHGLKDQKNPLYFIDATHPEHQSKPGYGWIYKGTIKAIQTTSKQKRVHVLGALSYPNKGLIFTEGEAVNSQTVISLFEKIKFKHTPGQTINIVLDNAKYQKSSIIQEYILNNPNIKLHYLPARSPNLNLIERVWKFMHKIVTNNDYYEFFENFRYSILSFLRNINHYKDELSTLLTFKFQRLNYELANFVK